MSSVSNEHNIAINQLNSRELFNNAMNAFKTAFQHELVGFLNESRPNFRAVVAGGYGLKSLLEHKYKLLGKIVTKDFDVTVSTYKSKMTFLQCYTHWMSKLLHFIQAQDRPQDFKIVVINNGKQYIPVLDFHRYAIIIVTYRHQDFVDIAFTNQKINKKMLDVKYSLQLGIPLKDINAYLQELLTLIYMENVSNVYPDLYDKRNPIDGYYPEKGKQDIERARVVCGVSKSKAYLKSCDFIKNTSLLHLSKMHWKTRDSYFKALQHLVDARKVIVKDLLYKK
jgi:hypothetical protein